MSEEFTCSFGGEAGYGVMSAGTIVAKAAMKLGLHAIVANEYPSLIKGGLNFCIVRISTKPLLAFEDRINFLGALSQQAFEHLSPKVCKGGTVVYDEKLIHPPGTASSDTTYIAAPLTSAIPGEASKVMANSALLGAFCAVTGFPLAVIQSVFETAFKKETIRKQNLDILQNAYTLLQSQFNHKAFPLPSGQAVESAMLITGNDAIAMGAIQAGCKFAAGYPMTPGSSVLTYLSDHAKQYGLVFKQAEDEIAAINMVIGAGFAGVRAMTSTSGGGFALMVEALGFAAQAEVPIVAVNAQRGGPSTGLPTRTAQADLQFILHASQGEFPRIVLAPGDIEECFYETHRIFNLAEQFQVPCIILTDKYLADTAFSQPFFKTADLAINRGKLANEEHLNLHQPYKRYQLTDDGISVRSIPGQPGGRYIATSYTHGEDGFYSSGNHEYAGDEPAIVTAGLDKLFAKVPFIEQELPALHLYGTEEADLTLIIWGSTKGAALSAMELATAEGLQVNVLQILYISPFPQQAFENYQQAFRRTLLIEGNKTGQLGQVIRSFTGYKPTDCYFKYDSRPFQPSQILNKIKEVLNNG